MASTVRNSPYAFVSEVARYLALEPADVRRLIRLDKLPATSIPRATRAVSRIPLRDLHAWLRDRTKNPAPMLADFNTFIADFNATARTATPATSAPA